MRVHHLGGRLVESLRAAVIDVDQSVSVEASVGSRNGHIWRKQEWAGLFLIFEMSSIKVLIQLSLVLQNQVSAVLSLQFQF